MVKAFFQGESAMAKMRAMVVTKPGGPLEVVERDLPEPGPEELRIRVLACGVCYSDSVTVEKLFPWHCQLVVDGIGEGAMG
jgi:D-arabinose 1-dehydrogenase-like Zn-dependent alcohol dehydrogenase